MTMTIEERDTARAIQSIAKSLDGRNINWEQRRYEIAKAVMANDAPNGNSRFSEESAKFAVACADALIKELQNNPMK